MKTIAKTIAALFLSVTFSYAGKLVNVSGASGIALNGYDPVAFFTAKKPTHGNPSIQAKYEGATYLFASKENKAMFESNPSGYAPQYGGYCAFGASVGALFPVDINTWQIRGGKLYLNLNNDIVKLFNKEFDKNIDKANTNWPSLIKKHVE